MPERGVQLGVVAALIRGRSYPPADVDVIVEQRFGQFGAAAERVQVAATEIGSAPVVDGVGERVAISKLELVPDEVHEIDGLGDRFGRPAATAGADDQFEAGVDAADVISEVGAA